MNETNITVLPSSTTVVINSETTISIDHELNSKKRKSETEEIRSNSKKHRSDKQKASTIGSKLADTEAAVSSDTEEPSTSKRTPLTLPQPVINNKRLSTLLDDVNGTSEKEVKDQAPVKAKAAKPPGEALSQIPVCNKKQSAPLDNAIDSSEEEVKKQEPVKEKAAKTPAPALSQTPVSNKKLIAPLDDASDSSEEEVKEQEPVKTPKPTLTAKAIQSTLMSTPVNTKGVKPLSPFNASEGSDTEIDEEIEKHQTKKQFMEAGNKTRIKPPPSSVLPCKKQSKGKHNNADDSNEQSIEGEGSQSKKTVVAGKKSLSGEKMPVRGFSVRLSAGRPKAVQNESFPLDNAKFQQKVLFLLNSLYKEIKEIKKMQVLMQSGMLHDDVEEFEQAKSVKELKELERRLTLDNELRRKLRKQLQILGNTCDDMRAHVRTASRFLMTTKTEVRVNLDRGNNVPTKNYSNHVSLKHDLPNVFSALLAAISKQWGTGEKQVQHAIAEWMKGATKRLDREQLKQLKGTKDN